MVRAAGLREPVSLTSTGALSPAFKDLAAGIFQLVPHTPVTAVGLNFQGHSESKTEMSVSTDIRRLPGSILTDDPSFSRQAGWGGFKPVVDVPGTTYPSDPDLSDGTSLIEGQEPQRKIEPPMTKEFRPFIADSMPLQIWEGTVVGVDHEAGPQDSFIGWSHEQRKKNLHLIVNNARFLILPWVQSKNLASMILAKAARRLPGDWETQFGYRPVLLETFVEKPRFEGTCYKAANWRYLGQTKGRGKLGPSGKQSVPIKDLWAYPLDAAFRAYLTG